MKNLLIPFIFYSLILTCVSIPSANAQPGVTFGKEKFDRGIYIHPTSDGNMLLVGYTNSFSKNGDEDYYIIKTTQTGEKIWEKTVGGDKSDIGFSFTELPDHKGYLIMGFSRSFGSDEDILLYRISETGDIIWKKNFDKAGHERCWSIRLLSDGHYLIVGQTQDHSAKRMMGMLTKIDSEGNILWQNTYGDFAYNRIYYSVENKKQELIIAGLTRTDSLGDNRGWIMRTDARGKVLASNMINTIPNTTFHGIMYTPKKKSILLMGYAQTDTAKEQRSIYLAWLDDAGTLKKEVTQHERGMVNHGLTATTLQNGDIVVTGYTRPLGQRAWDGLVCRFDRGGKLIWKKTFGKDKSDQFYTITTTQANELMLTGHTFSLGAGDADLWLVRLTEQGEILN